MPRKAEDQEQYASVSYSEVQALIDQTLEYRNNTMSNDVKFLIRHYNTLIRRHIISDSEIKQLVNQIYRKHKQALDIIFENIPDLQDELKVFLEDLINNESYLSLDDSGKKFIRFSTNSLDQYTDLQNGQSWTSTNKLLLFEFQNNKDSIVLKFIMGPGDHAIKTKVFNHINSNNVFNNPIKKLNGGFQTLYSKEFLRSSDYTENDTQTIKQQITKVFQEFINYDKIQIENEISKIGLK